MRCFIVPCFLLASFTVSSQRTFTSTYNDLNDNQTSIVFGPNLDITIEYGDSTVDYTYDRLWHIPLLIEQAYIVDSDLWAVRVKRQLRFSPDIHRCTHALILKYQDGHKVRYSGIGCRRKD